MHYLGLAYDLGGLVQVDYAKALMYFKLAADLGSRDDAYDLGLMYMNAKGVARDDKRAIVLFRSAARKGEPRSVKILRENHLSF